MLRACFRWRAAFKEVAALVLRLATSRERQLVKGLLDSLYVVIPGPGIRDRLGRLQGLLQGAAGLLGLPFLCQSVCLLA